MTIALFLTCTLCPLTDLAAYDPVREPSLENWLHDNRLLVSVQLKCLDLPVEVGYSREVLHYIERYLRPGRRETERMLGRAAYYLPVFERILRRQGLPEALKYLPMVESGLLPGIESPAGAVGLWQFMPATARYFGLTMNDWIDERCDPYRSTEMAARLLEHLYGEFCDWSLALAAYNCGPGRVKRLMRKVGSDRYEAIRPYLPGQTRRYIDRFKAVAYVDTYYELFGLTARSAAALPLAVVEVRLSRSLRFRDISAITQVPLPTIRALNPAYLRDVVPVSRGGRSVVLPGFAAEHLLAELEHDEKPVAGMEKKGNRPPVPVIAQRWRIPMIRRHVVSLDRWKNKFEHMQGSHQVAPVAAGARLPRSEAPGHEDPCGNDSLLALRQRPGFRFDKWAC